MDTVNAPLVIFQVMNDLKDADRRFAFIHVPSRARGAVKAIWTLDELLGDIVATTTQALIGQMRLTWWHERLSALPQLPAGEPHLAELAAHVLPLGVRGAELACIVEGWETLLEPMPLSESDLNNYAHLRGTTVFESTARVLGHRGDPRVGQAWALADFAARCTDAATTALAWNLARRQSISTALPRPLRILDRLARSDSIAARKLPRTRYQLWRAAL